LFGSGRIAKLGGELGQGLREFRKGLSGEDEAPPQALPATTNSTADSAAQIDAATKS
jgi:Sec-independent protein translocase protein TatA